MTERSTKLTPVKTFQKRLNFYACNWVKNPLTRMKTRSFSARQFAFLSNFPLFNYALKHLIKGFLKNCVADTGTYRRANKITFFLMGNCLLKINFHSIKRENGKLENPSNLILLSFKVLTAQLKRKSFVIQSQMFHKVNHKQHPTDYPNQNLDNHVVDCRFAVTPCWGCSC